MRTKRDEKGFMQTVLEAARVLRWRSAHFRPAMRQGGQWVTAVQGDAKGFPDLVLLRRQSMIVAELKEEGARPTAEQEAWLEAFRELPGVHVFVWRPSDWQRIKDALELL